MDFSYVMDRCKREGAVVIGLGRSNMPLIRYLTSHGVSVEARDRKTAEEIPQVVSELASLGAAAVLGEAYLDDLPPHVLFRSPGIRPDAGGIPDAVARGAYLTSEMELFFAGTAARLFGVTGSDGKTTTTTVLHKMLSLAAARSGGRAYVGGNIGEPLVDRTDEMTERDRSVVELSSFQLMTMTDAPEVSVITNITPNHLNWHVDYEEYIAAKARVLGSGCRRAVLNYENEITRALAAKTEAEVVFFSSSAAEVPSDVACGFLYVKDGYVTFAKDGEERKLLRADAILLPGKHNLENYMAAIGAAMDLVTDEEILAVATTFAGVAHRIEPVGEWRGVRFYNSSIDSTPTRTAAALHAMEREREITLIAGGYDKNIPFLPLGEAILQAKNVKTVVLTGATAEKISAAIEEASRANPRPLTVLMEKDFDAATRLAAETATPGGIVLLSPACASFDAFVNFEVRGNRFRALVAELPK